VLSSTALQPAKWSSSARTAVVVHSLQSVLPSLLLYACNAGFKALCDAFTAVTGDCKPFSITGSLPCIRDLQEAGFDVQTMGFGKLAAYHSNNGEEATMHCPTIGSQLEQLQYLHPFITCLFQPVCLTSYTTSSQLLSGNAGRVAVCALHSMMLGY